MVLSERILIIPALAALSALNLKAVVHKVFIVLALVLKIWIKGCTILVLMIPVASILLALLAHRAEGWRSAAVMHRTGTGVQGGKLFWFPVTKEIWTPAGLGQKPHKKITLISQILHLHPQKQPGPIENVETIIMTPVLFKVYNQS